MANVTFPVLEPFQFEKLIDGVEVIETENKTWHHQIYYSMVYLVVIFNLRSYMKEKEAFELKYLLAFWNFTMAFISIFATVRMLPGYLHLVWDFSMAFSICDQNYGLQMNASVFWGWLFKILKNIEYGDTVFIVLRKRKLTFLHYYHHALTAIITAFAIANRLPIGHGFIVANYFVHSLMYTYYMLAALNIKIPKYCSMALTSIQILQMLYGCFLCYMAFYFRAFRDDCRFPLRPIFIIIVMYVSYFFLFARFFYVNYVCSKKNKKE
ncbi:elongation of very long chain fatty acids protein 3-like [Centruroides sculpturatus]|uniref:elongation of very long chain fatty acids protein 3-like n=1 Tax=Centruroides sculpturatus TaxID=218467 RepID=UPI000C6E8457|nr:elongation of very long chain fatty acids protein 3-like [Centruroides sculpturatus]